MADTWQVNIYKINPDNKTRYNPQILEHKIKDNFDLHLYYGRSPKAKPDWKDFLSDIIEDEQPILTEIRNNNESFILFRQNFNFHENNNFGNVYREITTYLDKATIKKVGLDIDDNTNALCLAKTSFKVNKSITFDNLIKIVKKCDHIIENETVKIDVNNIKVIDHKKDKQLVEELSKKLYEKLWKLKTDKSLLSDIDLTHKDFNEFLTAYKFTFNAKELTDRDTLLLDIIDSISSLHKKEYITRLRNADMTSYTEDSELLTKGKFTDHLILELVHNSKSYFFINGKWFVITSSFIDELNENCHDFVKVNYNTQLTKSWSKTTNKKGGLSYIEGHYNLTYKGDSNYKSTIIQETINDNNTNRN